jgi:hypothetical protein
VALRSLILSALVFLALTGCASVKSRIPGIWETDKARSMLGKLKDADPDKLPALIFEEGGHGHLMGVECKWTLEGDWLYLAVEKGKPLFATVGAEKGRTDDETKLKVLDGGKALEWKLSREKGEDLTLVLLRTGDPPGH